MNKRRLLVTVFVASLLTAVFGEGNTMFSKVSNGAVAEVVVYYIPFSVETVISLSEENLIKTFHSKYVLHPRYSAQEHLYSALAASTLVQTEVSSDSVINARMVIDITFKDTSSTRVVLGTNIRYLKIDQRYYHISFQDYISIVSAFEELINIHAIEDIRKYIVPGS